MPHQCTNCGRTFPDGSKEMLSGCPDCGGNKFQFAPAMSGLDRGSSSASGDRSDERSTGGVADRSAGSNEGTVARAANTVRNWVSDDSRSSADATGSNEAGVADAPNSAGGSDERVPDSDTDEFPEWPETAREPSDRERSPDPSTESASGSGAGAASSPTDAVEFDPADADEDSAQASARSDVVSPDELPPPSGAPAGAAGADDDVPDHGRVVSEPTGDRPSLEDLRDELNDQFESIKIVQPGQYELNLMELYDREEYIVSLEEDGRYVIDVPDSWREADE